MRNKMFTRLISVLLAVSLFVSLFTMMAFAGGEDKKGEVLPPSGEVVSEPTQPSEPQEPGELEPPVKESKGGRGGLLCF